MTPAASFLPLAVPYATLQLNVQIEEAYLWMAGVGLLLLLLAGAFLYVLVQRKRDWLSAHFLRVDAWLTHRAPRTWHFVKERFSPQAWYGLALTGGGALFLLTIYWFVEITDSWIDEDVLYQIDRSVQQSLTGALSAPLEGTLRLFTHFGDLPFAIAVGVCLAVYFLYRRQRWQLLALVLVLGVGEGVLWTMKWIFARARPGDQLSSAVGYSFPSGHSFTAMVLYGFFIYLTWRNAESKGRRVFVTLALTLLILLVGLSRVLLSVHWVSDVLGGFTIGLAWLVCSLVAARAVQAYRTRHVAS